MSEDRGEGRSEELSVSVVGAITDAVVKGIIEQKEKEKAAGCTPSRQSVSVQDEIRSENVNISDQGLVDLDENKGNSEMIDRIACQDRPEQARDRQVSGGFQWEDELTGNDCQNDEYDSDVESVDLVEADLENAKLILRKMNNYRREIRALKDKEKQRLYGGSNTKDCPMPKFPNPRSIVYRNLDISHDFKLVEYNFPRTKFSGKPGTMDIYQFMTLLKNAQEYCPVHPRDFKRILLNRLLPPALGMAHGWFANPKNDLRKVLTRLYDSFCNSISTPDARHAMKTIEVPKGTSFSAYIAELEFLGVYASRGGSHPEENALLVSLLAQEGLEHGLPEQAFKLCFRKICEVREDLGREPHIEDITAALCKISREIDYEMKTAKNFQWGRDRESFMHTNKITPMHRTNNVFKGKTDKKYSPKINTVNVEKPKTGNQGSFKGTKPAGQSGQKKTVFGKGKGQNPKVKGQANGRMHCSFCHERTHTCAMGCYSIRDDNLKVYTGPPAQVPCSLCVSEMDTEYTHPVAKCPIRPRMMRHYLEGTAIPRGAFKEYFERKRSSMKNMKQ